MEAFAFFGTLIALPVILMLIGAVCWTYAIKKYKKTKV